MTRLSVVDGVISFDHANAEATDVGTDAVADTGYYTTVAPGANYLSQSITIRKNCAVIVFGFATIAADSAGSVQIRRGGINKTQEATISAVNCCYAGGYGWLVYACELLPPGTYTYTLTNGSGVIKTCLGCGMKIVAINPFER